MNNITVLRIFQRINVFLLLPSLIILISKNDALYYLLSVLSILLISKVGGSIGLHRFYSHASFKMKKYKHYFVSLMATLCTSGSILQFSTIHRYHHKNSDKNDLHSPHEIGLWKSFWHLYEKDPKTISPLIIKDLLKDKWLIFLHNYYFLVIAIYITFLGLVDPYLIFFCYLLPSGFSWWTSGITSTLSHNKLWGYRNFETTDNTNNSTLVNILTLGEGLHNNHHYKPNYYNNAFTKNKYEWDINAFIIEKFLKCHQ
jgi:stearoyl-CoA desaturase (delta-9 desaturase)